MFKSDVIKEKLSNLVGFLKELQEVARGATFEEYKSNPSTKRASERLIQLIVETASDINSAVITGLDQRPPKDYYDTFIKAGEVKFIPASLAIKLASWAGLRNRLVHEYDTVKDSLVFEKINSTLVNFRQYVQEVEKFLEKYVKGGTTIK